MKSKILLFTLLNLYTGMAFAQPNLITCSSERNNDNSISIFSDSRAYGEYTVKLHFTSFSGYSANKYINSDIVLATAQPGKTELLRLKQEKSSGTYSFQYTYRYFPGRALRKAPDSNYLYLLPAAAGSSVRISKVTSLAEKLGKKSPEEFYAVGFIYKLGDTICASRGGIVYACNEDVKDGESSTQFFKSGRNKVSIQHKDGSLGNYEMLAPIKLLVSPGDYVYPGQRLAVFNKESDKYVVLLSNYYLDEKKLYSKINNGDQQAPSNFDYMATRFYTGEDDKSTTLILNKKYTVQQPKEIIVAEMSKRDKKKLGFD